MRKREKYTFFCFFTFIVLAVLFWGCRKETETVLGVDFTYTVIDSNYNVPVTIAFNNNTKGALFYKWTFPGGTPSTSDYREPGAITFKTPGPITIRLEAWNDGQRKEKTITILLDTVPKASFSAVPAINNVSPAEWDFAFTGEGASQYNWKFDKGMPSASADKNPKGVSYTSPGDYRISLEIKNARGRVDTISRIITVLPPLNASFDIVPSFEDEDDYEAPLTATLDNHTTSATQHQWQAPGGVLSNAADSAPRVVYPAPGTYTVTYVAGNQKQTQTLVKQITVKPNSGMRAFYNVRLGINTAHDSIGSFFSTYLRRVIKKDGVNNATGPYIDLCYFGLSESFSFNKFLSPNDVQNWTFQSIPGSTNTSVINKQESCNCGNVLSSFQFDAITNGSAFDPLPVSAGQGNTDAFDNSQLPRVLLFRNAAGKKGSTLR